MDINEIFQKVHKLSPDTPLHNVLYYENLIFKKIQDSENDILHKSIKYQEIFKSNIFRKEKQIDKLEIINQDIILSYQKKEALYKFPDKLVSLQNEILHTTQKIKVCQDKYYKQRTQITILLYNLQQVENNFMVKLKQQDKFRFKCDMLVSFSECKFETIESEYLHNLHHLNHTYLTKNVSLDKKILHSRKQQFNLVLEELTSKFRKKNIINQLLQEKTQLFVKLQTDELDSLKLNNYGMQIKIETDIFHQKIKTNVAKIQNLQKTNQDLLLNQIKIRFDFKKKKAALLKSKTGSVNSFYRKLENIMSKLKNLEAKISQLEITKKTIIHNLNQLNLQNDTIAHDLYMLQTKLSQFEEQKKYMLPGIIKKYNFYMNFYHYDLKETKIKINVLQRDLDFLRKKNVLEQSDITECYQKINILKKLQEYINKKFYDAPTSN